MCLFSYVICRYDFFAIFHAFLDPWKAGNHVKPWDGLTKSRFRSFRKIDSRLQFSVILGAILEPFGSQSLIFVFSKGFIFMLTHDFRNQFFYDFLTFRGSHFETFWHQSLLKMRSERKVKKGAKTSLLWARHKMTTNLEAPINNSKTMQLQDIETTKQWDNKTSDMYKYIR